MSLASTSYHLGSSIKNSITNKTKDGRQQNNFMSIIETKGKDDSKNINNNNNPKSQSVLQDYNIKYEKKSVESSFNANKKKGNNENNKSSALSKLIKGPQSNYRTGQIYYKMEENIK